MSWNTREQQYTSRPATEAEVEEEEVQQEQQQQQEQPQETLKQQKMRSRRAIKLLYTKCPLCNLKLTNYDKVVNDENDPKLYFQLLQFGTNPDGTGYESYRCDQCQRFLMVIIGSEAIIAQYEFKPAKKKQERGGGIGDLFDQLLGGNGRGNGGPM